ncbi:MAG TPA: hypothetical protein VF815_22965 [Myxococcaceae bacterium]|jgi:hypothetical protein
MRLKNSAAQLFLLALCWGCSGAEPTGPSMPPPSRDEGWEDGAAPEGHEEGSRSGGSPVAMLRSPEEGASYQQGGVITFEGRGTDAEDGALPATAFTWRVDVHSGARSHTFVPPISGMARGSFTVPELAQAEPGTWYRIHLQVKDSEGNTHTVFRDVHPSEGMARVR